MTGKGEAWWLKRIWVNGGTRYPLTSCDDRFGARPWKNVSAEDGGSTSIVQEMAGAALIQDLRPGLLAVAVQHR